MVRCVTLRPDRRLDGSGVVWFRVGECFYTFVWRAGQLCDILLRGSQQMESQLVLKVHNLVAIIGIGIIDRTNSIVTLKHLPTNPPLILLA